MIPSLPYVLAETAAGGIAPETVGTMIAAVIVALISGGVLGKKVSDSTRTTIEGQPLMVRMQDEFVTRREFISLEGRMATDVKEMKGLFREAISTINERDKHMQQSLKEIAETDYKGRTAIWEQVNEQRAHLKSVEDRMHIKPSNRS